MERKIGERFEFEGATLEVVEADGCEGCYFLDIDNNYCYRDLNISGECTEREEMVIFKLHEPSIFHRNYQAVIKRGLINSETTQADFEAKILDEVDEVVQAQTKEDKAEELGDVMAVCASNLIHMGYDPIEIFKQVTEKNERRAANLE